MMLSALSFTAMNGLVKYLDHIGSYQLVFFRSAISLILCLLYLNIKGVSPLGTKRGWLLLRGVVGTISLTLFFLAIKQIPLGTAVTLRYLSPVFAAILAFFLLGERIKKVQWLFFLMAFTGAALLKGFDLRVSLYGFCLIISSAIFSGMVYAIIKKIGTSEHPFVIVAYFMAVGSFAGLILSIPNWTVPSGYDLLLLTSIGALGFLGQIFMTLAIQSDDLTRVIPFKYVEAVLAVLVGIIWFGEGFGLVAIAGIGLVLTGMLLNLFYSRRV